MMGDDLFKLDHDLSAVDTGDAMDDDKSLVNEPQNDCIDDCKQPSQNANHVPVFDELVMFKLFYRFEYGSVFEYEIFVLDENDLLGQLFAENPQELACYTKNHVPMYDNHDYRPDRLRKIQFTLAHSHRYATQGLDMLDHAALVLAELTELQTSQVKHVSEAHLEGVIQWAEQMGAYAEVLDDYCDEVHEFALYLIDFDLDDPMFARHQQLEAVADELIREQRQMIARVRVEREKMKQRQLWYQESLKFLHLDFPNVEAEEQVNSSQDVKAQSAEDQVNVQGNSGKTNAVEEQKLQD